ncbi:MAG: hypothetical protein ACRDB0_00380 [Paraclostridium sp.]
MEELNFLIEERKRLHEDYLVKAKEIWIDNEGVEADKKHKKVYKEYSNKDYFLSGLQARLEDILKEIEYYKNK